jgi:RNA polymerase sigma-70 factor (ECF subfamily)
VCAQFKTTRWSVVLAAGGEPGERSREALAELFEAYWYPVYGFVRGQGLDDEDARDLVQSYFTALLDKRRLDGLNPGAGRFRSFVLVSVRNFLSNERDRLTAEKRGGGKVIESLDMLVAERRLAHEPSRPADADRQFERRWAETVVRRSMTRLEREFRDAGREEQFRLISGTLNGTDGALPYAAIAERLDISEAGVKSLVHRTRKRFGVLLRGEVLQTLDRPDEVEDEIRYLLRVLSDA